MVVVLSWTCTLTARWQDINVKLAMASYEETSSPGLSARNSRQHDDPARGNIALVYLASKSPIQACTSVRSIIAATPMGHKRGAAAPKIVRWCSFSIPFGRASTWSWATGARLQRDAADLPADRKQFRECGLFALFNIEKRREKEEARKISAEFKGSPVGAGGAGLGWLSATFPHCGCATPCIRAAGVVMRRELAGLSCMWVGSWIRLGSSMTTPCHDTP